MHSTMRTSSDSERSSLCPSFTTSLPSSWPRADSVGSPEVYPSPKSSPPDIVRKTELDKIYKLIHRLSKGKADRTAGNRKFTVALEDWCALKDEIFLKGDIISSETRAWAGDKLHYHYDADESTFEVKMPAGVLHEKIKVGFRKLLEKKLEAFHGARATELPPGFVLEQFEDHGQPVTDFDTGSEREPDVAMGVVGLWPPPFMAEIADSQRGVLEFRGISKSYILRSKGKVRTMVGIDIEYRDLAKRQVDDSITRWCTYHIFRRRMDGKKLSVANGSPDPVAFKDASGVVNANSRIPLTLADFVRSDGVDLSNLDLDITHQELHDVTVEAENALKVQQAAKLLPEEDVEIVDSDDSSSPEQDDDSTGDNEATSVSTQDTHGSTKRKRSTTGEENVDWAFAHAHQRAASPSVVIKKLRE
ncbi:hypothetical protein J4E93_010565 [Alternaria ventricosa]|uniref:uncharacterized protein n=1 Tax=Alternaria ventricosa TaxID=1187951 RepID=UPI0020C3343F|nr:uncharacterized protein J4E93_010565 [Alternaria ventricosa]KAI4637165.1 hypothetical protein J4E93_010565 [Alternaria ventricosa]